MRYFVEKTKVYVSILQKGVHVIALAAAEGDSPETVEYLRSRPKLMSFQIM